MTAFHTYKRKKKRESRKSHIYITAQHIYDTMRGCVIHLTCGGVYFFTCCTVLCKAVHATSIPFFTLNANTHMHTSPHKNKENNIANSFSPISKSIDSAQHKRDNGSYLETHSYTTVQKRKEIRFERFLCSCHHAK